MVVFVRNNNNALKRRYSSRYMYMVQEPGTVIGTGTITQYKLLEPNIIFKHTNKTIFHWESVWANTRKR